MLEAIAIIGIAVVAGAAFGLGTQRPHNSDDFWRAVAFEGVMAENFESLKEMANSSDVVVTGHLLKLEESRSWVALPELGDDGVAFYAKASVRVDEVLAGAYAADSAGNLGVEIFLTDWRKLPDLAGSMPTEQVLLLLRRQPDTKLPLYRIVNIQQGYLRDVGRVETPIGVTEPWLLDLDGRAFADVVADVRASARTR